RSVGLAPRPPSTHGTCRASRHPPSPTAVALTSPPVLARPVLARPVLARPVLARPVLATSAAASARRCCPAATAGRIRPAARPPARTATVPSRVGRNGEG